MKKICYTIVLALMAVAICVQVTTAQGESELRKISLTYSDHAPPTTEGIIFMQNEYLPRVQKELAKVGYELEITFHHSESLLKSMSKFRPVNTVLLILLSFQLIMRLT